MEGPGGSKGGEAAPLLPQSAGQAVSAPPGEEPALSPPQIPARNQSTNVTIKDHGKELPQTPNGKPLHKINNNNKTCTGTVANCLYKRSERNQSNTVITTQPYKNPVKDCHHQMPRQRTCQPLKRNRKILSTPHSPAQKQSNTVTTTLQGNSQNLSAQQSLAKNQSKIVNTTNPCKKKNTISVCLTISGHNSP